VHELRIAQEIIAIVGNEIRQRRLVNATEIGLRLGPLSGVDSEALSFSFKAAVADSSLEQAELVITHVPVKATCRDCGKDVDIQDFFFFCPSCESPDVDVIEGDELEVSYIIADEDHDHA